MLTRNEVIDALVNADLVPSVGRNVGRTIYRTAGNDYCIDYATYPGGVIGEVPRSVIDALERDGIIQRKYPDKPELEMWQLRRRP